MAYLISYLIGFIGAFALFQVMSVRTRGENDSRFAEMAANMTLAVFWPLIFGGYLMAALALPVVGFVAAAIRYRKRGFPATRGRV